MQANMANVKGLYTFRMIFVKEVRLSNTYESILQGWILRLALRLYKSFGVNFQGHTSPTLNSYRECAELFQV